mmetsp:Transcript_19319/g.61224  ORF Transcript_19319/g.61224 Transcript_19319/m.61224 type:complete len:354 (-) Transcript_19319:816-1877(-)
MPFSISEGVHTPGTMGTLSARARLTTGSHKPGATRKAAPAATASSTCASVSTVPAPTHMSGPPSALRREAASTAELSACSAAGVRSMSSTHRTPPAARARITPSAWPGSSRVATASTPCAARREAVSSSALTRAGTGPAATGPLLPAGPLRCAGFPKKRRSAAARSAPEACDMSPSVDCDRAASRSPRRQAAVSTAADGRGGPPAPETGAPWAARPPGMAETKPASHASPPPVACTGLWCVGESMVPASPPSCATTDHLTLPPALMVDVLSPPSWTRPPSPAANAASEVLKQHTTMATPHAARSCWSKSYREAYVGSSRWPPPPTPGDGATRSAAHEAGCASVAAAHEPEVAG